MAETTSSATITLDLQGGDQNQIHSNAINDLIISLNKLDERVDKQNKLQEHMQNMKDQVRISREKSPDYFGINQLGTTSEAQYLSGVSSSIQEYGKAHVDMTQNMKTFGFAFGEILATLTNNVGQYAKASNVMIGSNLFNAPLLEAQKKIQERSALVSGSSELIGGTIGSLVGALPIFGGPLGSVVGSIIGTNVANNVASYFNDKFARQTTLEANIEKQQQVIAGFTKQNLINTINPDTNNSLKTTQDFADLLKIKGMQTALSFQAAQQGVLLNTTGTQSINASGAATLAKEITAKTGNIYTPEQSQQFGSIVSGLFAHSGVSENGKKQTDLLQKILDNASKYGIDPAQYTQQLYQRQQFMGGSVENAMQFANMGVVQGWTYANAVQQLERAPVMQRLTGNIALQAIGFKGTYEDLFKPGGIEQLEKKAGNLRDPYNFNAMLLQNSGFDLWGLKSGASPGQAQENNTRALMDNIKALQDLTSVIMGKSYNTSLSTKVSNSNYDAINNYIGETNNVNDYMKNIKLNNDNVINKNIKVPAIIDSDTMIPPIVKVTH